MVVAAVAAAVMDLRVVVVEEDGGAEEREEGEDVLVVTVEAVLVSRQVHAAKTAMVAVAADLDLTVVVEMQVADLMVSLLLFLEAVLVLQSNALALKQVAPAMDVVLGNT